MSLSSLIMAMSFWNFPGLLYSGWMITSTGSKSCALSVDLSPGKYYHLGQGGAIPVRVTVLLPLLLWTQVILAHSDSGTE